MSDVIREYLVGLGFKVDEKSWQQFNAGLARSAKSAAQLGAETAAASIAISTAIERVARQYEELYYVSQRAGSSIGSLKAYEYGMRQIGLSAGQARGMVEGVAAAVRMNPGLQAMMRNMGLDPGDAQKAAVGLVGRLKATYGEGGYFVAARMAQMYGVEEGVFRQLWQNFDRLNARQDEYNKKLEVSGLNTDQVAQKSVTFTNALDSLYASIGLIGDQTANKWLPSMTETVTWLDKVALAVVRAGKDTDGWSSSIVSLGAALGGVKATSWLLRMLGFGAAGTAVGGGASIGAGLAVVGGAHVLAGRVREEAKAGTTDEPNSVSNMFGLIPYLESKYGKYDPKTRTVTPPANSAPGSGDGSVVAFFMKQGWSREQAAGIAANLKRESNFNPAATGDGGSAYGVAQWHPDRQAAFKAWAGKDIRQSSMEEQLAFIHHELTKGNEQFAGRKLKGATTAAEAGGIVSRYYERPRDIFGESMQRGALAQDYFNASLTPAPSAGNNVQVSQKTDIHVAAGATAADTARSVVDAQDRVNGDLVRNTVGAVR